MSDVVLSGRRAQAARNDELILESARAVFVADPGAPITAVAKHAGVGISALYSRYGSKEELLRTLCRDGLQRFVDETEAALADDREPWTMFSDWMRRLVDADTSSLTLALAGSFTPTPDLFTLGNHANELTKKVYARVAQAAATGDRGQRHLTRVRARRRDPDRRRTRTRLLRHRYLATILDGMRAGGPGAKLPGPGPTWQELSERWAR